MKHESSTIRWGVATLVSALLILLLALTVDRDNTVETVAAPTPTIRVSLPLATAPADWDTTTTPPTTQPPPTTIRRVQPPQPPRASRSQSVQRAVPATPPSDGWQQANVTWYGPGLYGNGTACGQTMTPDIVGVAHKSLPCGTRVTFNHNGKTVTAPVIDRGPFVKGKLFDLSHGLCRQLDHCWTGPINYRIG